MFYELDVEVPGGLGEKTEIDTSKHPPIVKKLHFEFEGWVGGHLITTFPCFLISKDLINLLKNKTGIETENCKITFNSDFPVNKRKIPKFKWLKVFGKPGIDDFGISKDFNLVVSESVLNLIKEKLGKSCTIKKYSEKKRKAK